MKDITPFARQYPHLTNAELAARLRDVAAHPERYGRGDTSVLLNVAACRLGWHMWVVADNVTERERNHPDGYVYCSECYAPGVTVEPKE
jgi:hypothetical protein